MREVPGSNPGWALQRSTRQVQLLPPPGHQPHTHRLIGFFGTYTGLLTSPLLITYKNIRSCSHWLHSFARPMRRPRFWKLPPDWLSWVVAGVAREDKSEPQPATTKLTLTLTWLLRHQTHLAASPALMEAIEKTIREIFCFCAFKPCLHSNLCKKLFYLRKW